MGKRSKEFWDNAFELCRERGWRIAEVARELGVKYQTLYNRVHKMRQDGVRTEQEPESLTDENKRLRRQNERLAEELEIAKKAAAFFARHQK
jgi:transposase